MSLSASLITASCELATNAPRRNPGRSPGWPPHQVPTARTTSTPSVVLIVEVAFIVSRLSLSVGPAARGSISARRGDGATEPGLWAGAGIPGRQASSGGGPDHHP